MSVSPEKNKIDNSNIEPIKEWLKQQPHLPDFWDKHWIRTYLERTNFSLEKCKKKIDLYFSVKAAAPEFFTNRDVSKLKRISKFVYTGQLPPTLTLNGHKVFISSFIKTNLDDFNFIDLEKTAFMIGDAICLLGNNEALGEIWIIDVNSDFCAYMLKSVSISQLKLFWTSLQQAFPLKIKEIHFLNVSPMLQSILLLIRPFLKEKIYKRIHLHADIESLCKHVSLEILPEEYGGSAGSLQDLSNEMWKTLEKCQEWFKETEDVKADETKRPEKGRNTEELFGVDGSFRQLEVD